MPKRSSTNGVPTEAQVKAAIQRGAAAVKEIHAALTDVRELSQQLNDARNQMQEELGTLLHGAPPQAMGMGSQAGRIR